ncbi:Single hybrid motif superfamily protein isoform 2 [Hibiscus syriacus]|uniref:Single hybrid motif superfamily protein isoform 2 n=1 Tax=Hibiscus syriacus TaxID=106335 RepID=A0A6A2WB24_HIBSY|nr:Single hybrid motif superfamily protein isoform 2 [Hibiscus syriacus]
MPDIMLDQAHKPEEAAVPNNLQQHHKQDEEQQQSVIGNAEYEDEELHKLLVPDIAQLPLTPPSSVESNFASYFAPDFMKPGNDQYVYRHPNGLCVVGLASTHSAFKDKGGVSAVDFNIGKSNRSGVVLKALLEVNERLIKQPGLLNSSADREGYIAIIMPKPADWHKVKASLLSLGEFKKLREAGSILPSHNSS